MMWPFKKKTPIKTTYFIDDNGRVLVDIGLGRHTIVYCEETDKLGIYDKAHKRLYKLHEYAYDE